MAGGNPPKPPSNKSPKPTPPSSHRYKSHRESSSSTSAAAATTTTTPSNKKPSTSEPNKPKPTSNNLKPPTPKPKPSPKPTNPSPKPDPIQLLSKLPPFPFPDPPPPPSYGFHMLDRRTFVLADGSVRSYFALPPDYPDFTPLPPRPEFRVPGLGFDRNFPMNPDFRGPELGEMGDGFMRGRSQEYRNVVGFEGRGNGLGMVERPVPGTGPGNSIKRKFGDEERVGRDGFERQRQQLLQYGNADGYLSGVPGPSSGGRGRVGGEEMRAAKFMRIDEGNVGKLKHNEVDQAALEKAFLHFVKIVYDNPNQKKKYLADGKQGSLQCIACGRSSKDFSDMHGLIMHVYTSDHPNLIVDHLGLHKALCVLMGWNYRTPPDKSKVYRFLSAEEAAANLDDLIMWPPFVIIHNTNTGKGREGRMEGLGNRAMDNYIRDLGFHGGKSKSLYSKDGHLGITLIKFGADQAGLKQAVQLAEYFKKDNRGRNGWARVESLNVGKDDDSNPNLVKVNEKTREKERIFYGYLATITDMDKVDFETRKKCAIQSRREQMTPN